MPPKEGTNEPFYPQHQRSWSDMSVNDILMQYQGNSQLLSQILMAKAEEDKVSLQYY
jgi:hypothetical protein